MYLPEFWDFSEHWCKEPCWCLTVNPKKILQGWELVLDSRWMTSTWEGNLTNITAFRQKVVGPGDYYQTFWAQRIFQNYLTYHVPCDRVITSLVEIRTSAIFCSMYMHTITYILLHMYDYILLHTYDYIHTITYILLHMLHRQTLHTCVGFFWKLAQNGSNQNKFERVIDNPEQTTAKIHDLHPETAYTVSVEAHTSAGGGPAKHTEASTLQLSGRTTWTPSYLCRCIYLDT